MKAFLALLLLIPTLAFAEVTPFTSLEGRWTSTQEIRLDWDKPAEEVVHYTAAVRSLGGDRIELKRCFHKTDNDPLCESRDSIQYQAHTYRFDAKAEAYCLEAAEAKDEYCRHAFRLDPKDPSVLQGIADPMSLYRYFNQGDVTVYKKQ